MIVARVLFLMAVVLASGVAEAQTIPLVTSTPMPNGNTEYALGIQILMVMTVLTLLPAMLITMTAFTRILSYLPSFVRRSGHSKPVKSNHSRTVLFLTLFIMSPVIDIVWAQALTPYLMAIWNFRCTCYGTGTVGELCFRRPGDTIWPCLLSWWLSVSLRVMRCPICLLPSFLTSELKTAFQIGFLLFVPFLVIDLVVRSAYVDGYDDAVANIISLPFKLMLFVLIDGWSLISATLVSSFAL